MREIDEIVNERLRDGLHEEKRTINIHSITK